MDEQSPWPPLGQSFYRDAHLFVHLHQQVVMLDGETVRLNRLECRLLAILVEHAGGTLGLATREDHFKIPESSDCLRRDAARLPGHALCLK